MWHRPVRAASLRKEFHTYPTAPPQDECVASIRWWWIGDAVSLSSSSVGALIFATLRQIGWLGFLRHFWVRVRIFGISLVLLPLAVVCSFLRPLCMDFYGTRSTRRQSQCSKPLANYQFFCSHDTYSME